DGAVGDTSHQARKSDHNPDWSAPGRRRGVVRALDITTRGIDVNRLLKHTTNDSRVSYVIYNRRIYQHSTGWKPYYGSNPHTQHVHVSIAHTRTAERDLKNWIHQAIPPPRNRLPRNQLLNPSLLRQKLRALCTRIVGMPRFIRALARTQN